VTTRDPGASEALTRDGLETFLDGLFGEQAGGEHDGGIAGVGATGDGGDENVAVMNLAFPRTSRVTVTGSGVGRLWAISNCGGGVGILLQRVLQHHRGLAATAGQTVDTGQQWKGPVQNPPRLCRNRFLSPAWRMF